jgi:aromatic-L-amino-acid decarboxylase
MSEINESSRSRLSSLDLSREALQLLSSQVTQLVNEYFLEVTDLPVFPQLEEGQNFLQASPGLPHAGEPVETLLSDCRTIFGASRHNGHPRFFGYVASPATPPGAFADLLASTLNPNVTSWRSAPAATEVEKTVIRWLGSMIGYSDHAQGVLTSGGSMANMIALLVAHRAKSDADVGRNGLWKTKVPMTIYASDQIHLSILKAADVLGIGSEQVRLVDCDDRFRLDVSALRARLERDRQNDIKPFCVVASAGTVNTGAIDPLNEIAVIAKEFNLWFHVDGAYGAPGALDARKRSLFAGLERADSISLDPHKWLYVPLDAGCLLFHDADMVRSAFNATGADYIQIHEDRAAEAFAFWDYSVELSRRFRALKIWLTLRYYGLERIAAAISEDISLAEYLAQRVREAQDFELLAPVELSICCFRYVPHGFPSPSPSDKEGERASTTLDRLNEQIMHAVQRGGKAYLSNATIRGQFALRACITNFRTTRSDIDQTLEIIRETARTLQ